MAQKTCRVCYQHFHGRRDARTCSSRCRKRLSRTRREIAELDFSLSESLLVESSEVGQKTGIASRLVAIRHLRQLMIILAGSLFFALGGLGSGGATAEISQGYLSTDTALSKNMAVMLTGDTIDGYPLVQATDSDHQPKNALGVAIGLNESLLAVSPVSTGVYVVSDGPVEVYVSDLNGAPKVGDLLAISPLKGVLMKSIDETVASFGVALQDFNSSNSQPIDVKDRDGNTISTNVSLMSINVDVNPPLKSATSEEDDWLKSTAFNLTGQKLSGVRIIAILMVFFTMMVIVSEIIYGVVSGSINALGRNPLAREAITRQSVRGLAMAGLGMAFGTIIIVALIWF